MPVVGVDPGGRHTGVVVRHGSMLRYWALLKRDTPIDWYLGEIVDTITKARDLARQIAIQHNGFHRVPIAVEDLDDPTPQMGLTTVRGLIDTAQVLGAIAGTWPITRIPPAGHGAAPLRSYPDDLVDDSERKGRGRLRHVRAAWDIAGAAPAVIARQEANQ